MAERVVTFCRICEAHCGMVATVEDGRVTQLRPDPDHPLSSGYACPKGIAMTDVQNDPDRVLHPLRKTASGEFEPVTWQEALADIGTRLRAVREEHGPKSIGWYMGNPGAFSYSHTLWAKGFLDGLGSPHYYTAGSQDVNNRFAASAMLYGSPLVVPIPDLARTSFLLMLGANPMVSHGSVLTAPRIRDQLRAITGRGGRVVVLDPRRTETARQFEHVGVRPDSDAWLLLSLLQVIFEEGLADRRFLAGWTRDSAALERAAAPHTPESTEERTGVPAEDVRRLARDFAAADGAAAYGRTGSRLRPPRLVPRPSRHRRRLPPRRAERRHRQPRPPGRRRIRATRDCDRGRRRREPSRELRAQALPRGRLPGRDRQHAGLADPEGDRDARRGPAASAVRERRQPRPVGARRRCDGARARPARPHGLARLLRERDEQARRLRAADHDLPRARRHSGGFPRLLHEAVRAALRCGRAADGRGARGVGDRRGPGAPDRRDADLHAGPARARPAGTEAAAAARARPAAAHGGRGRLVRPAARRAVAREAAASPARDRARRAHRDRGPAPQAAPPRPPRAPHAGGDRGRAPGDEGGARDRSSLPGAADRDARAALAQLVDAQLAAPHARRARACGAHTPRRRHAVRARGRRPRVRVLEVGLDRARGEDHGRDDAGDRGGAPRVGPPRRLAARERRGRR